MAFLLPVAMAGLSALGGYLANKKQTTDSSGTQSTTSSSSGTSTNNVSGSTTPVLDPNAAAFKDSILAHYSKLLDTPFDASGYLANATNAANAGADIQKRNNLETLAANGVAGPAVATSVNSAEAQRVGSIVNTKNQIPQLQQQYMMSILQNAGNFFSQIPVGSSTQGSDTSSTSSTGTSSTNQTGTVTAPGNVLGGAVGNGANTLAYLYGLGAFRPTAPGNTGMNSGV
jgi:hypothetical protein